MSWQIFLLTVSMRLDVLRKRPVKITLFEQGRGRMARNAQVSGLRAILAGLESEFGGIFREFGGKTGKRGEFAPIFSEIR